jgi:hypothetical protein
LCEVIHDAKFYGLAELVQVQSSVELVQLVCNAGVLRCVVFYVVVATLEASDWLVFLLL